MRILCTNQSLSFRGGSESYLETIAEALRTLGHEVEFFTEHPGPLAARFAELGFTVHCNAADLPDSFDVIHAQHASAALAARVGLPDTPMVFACHSWFVGLEIPPAACNIGAAIAFNDRTMGTVRGSAIGADVPVHRLTQPIHRSAFDQQALPIQASPTRAVVVSRTIGERLPLLERECAARGIALTCLGVTKEVDDPIIEVMSADITIGMGRSILDGMMLGRAVLVYDINGCGGWVNASTYSELEASGFTPVDSDPVPDLGAVLDAYDPMYGLVAREYAVRHHAAESHAAALVDIYRGVNIGNPPASSPLEHRLRASLYQQLFASEKTTRDAQWAAAASLQSSDATAHRLPESEAEGSNLAAQIAGDEAMRGSLLTSSDDGQPDSAAHAHAQTLVPPIVADDLAKIERLRREREDLRRQAATAEREVDRLRGAEATLDNRLNEANAEIAALRHSVSWRITRPLRGIRRLLRRR